jgi:TPR repeat protein
VQRTLVDRGNAMLNLGNVSAARMLFTRAAESGIGIAAFKLANTYDPMFLHENNLLGIKPDPAAAEAWYRKAAAMGEVEAERRLQSLKRHSLTDALSTR